MTSEQVELVLKAHDSLKAAQLLIDNKLQDFAISRAYYTMFYIAEALLLGEGLSYSSHGAVIAKFGEIFAKTNRVPTEYHRFLIKGQVFRHQGDYNAPSGLSEANATEQIENAKKFLELAEQMLGKLP